MSYLSASSKRKPVLFALLVLYVTALLTSMAGMEIFGWSLVAAVLFFFLTGPNRSWRQFQENLGLPLGGLLLCAILSDLINGYDWLHLIVTIGEFRWIVLLFAFTWAIRESDFLITSQGKFRYWLLAVFVVTAVTMWMQFRTGVDLLRPGVRLDPTTGNHWRAQGFFNICITTAYALGVQMMFYFGRGLVTKFERPADRLAWIDLVNFALGSWAVYLTFTRGAWLAWFITIIVVSLIWRPHWKTVLGLIVFFTLVIIPVRTLGDREISDRVESIRDTNADASNSQRIVLWKANLQIIKEHPLFGVGWNQNSKFVHEAYKEIGHSEAIFISHSHNNYLQTLGGLGFVGFFFYCWFCLLMLWRALRLFFKTKSHAFAQAIDVRAVAIGSLAGQLYFHLGGMTQCNFIDAEVNHNLVFVWAMTLVAEGIYKRHSTLVGDNS